VLGLCVNVQLDFRVVCVKPVIRSFVISIILLHVNQSSIDRIWERGNRCISRIDHSYHVHRSFQNRFLRPRSRRAATISFRFMSVPMVFVIRRRGVSRSGAIQMRHRANYPLIWTPSWRAIRISSIRPVKLSKPQPIKFSELIKR